MGTNHGQRGVTLLELMIGSVILAVVAGGAYALMGTGVDTYRIGAIQSEVERRANHVMEEITAELAQAGRDVLYPAPVPPVASASLTLQKNEGWSGDAIDWSTPTVIEFRHAPDDPDDGVDNNGNGLVDEGQIVQRLNAGRPDEYEVVLSNWVREYLEGEEPNGKDDNGNGLVDEPGLSFDVMGEVWTVRLTLERRDGKGRLATHTVQTSVKTRN